MRRPTSLLARLAVAAIVSGLAAILMVTVGPGFAEKPDDLGPNEHAAEQAQDNAADESASEDDADVDASEQASGNAAENASDNAADNAGGPPDAGASDQAVSGSAEAAAGNGAKPDGPPGQQAANDAEALAGGGAGNSENANAKVNEDTSQTGLPRGQSADDCTNKHQGADPQQGGANRNPGPYDNTCDGRASENGQGGGNANGRPCMGCVGNADDKNPPGQLPNGRDHNAGYECDRNKGVGQGNPAHTDCQPNQPPCTDNPNTPKDECNEDEDDPDCLGHVPPHPQHQPPHPACDDDEDEPDCLGHVPPHPQHQPGHPACENQDRLSICHRAGNAAVILRDLPRPAAEAHLNNPAHNDFIVDDDDDVDRCINNVALFTVCHVDGDDFDVIGGLTEEELEEHLDEHDDDFEIRDAGDLRECDEDEEDEDCLGHSPPHDNHEPGDAACDDVEDRLTICHVEGNEGTILRNLDEDDAEDHLDNHPADFIVDDDDAEEECGEEPPVVVTVCPASSDRPMRVIPEGRTAAWCYIDDEVQGEVINRIPRPGMPKPNVQGKLVPRPETRGGLLPFTGASLLAFLVLALQLIAAGSLIMRGRKA